MRARWLVLVTWHPRIQLKFVTHNPVAFNIRNKPLTHNIDPEDHVALEARRRERYNPAMPTPCDHTRVNSTGLPIWSTAQSRNQFFLSTSKNRQWIMIARPAIYIHLRAEEQQATQTEKLDPPHHNVSCTRTCSVTHNAQKPLCNKHIFTATAIVKGIPQGSSVHPLKPVMCFTPSGMRYPLL